MSGNSLRFYRRRAYRGIRTYTRFAKVFPFTYHQSKSAEDGHRIESGWVTEGPMAGDGAPKPHGHWKFLDFDVTHPEETGTNTIGTERKSLKANGTCEVDNPLNDRLRADKGRYHNAARLDSGT